MGGVERACRRSPVPRVHQAERATSYGAAGRARLKKVGGETVPPGMARHAPVALRQPRRFVDGLLYGGCVQGVEDGPPRRRGGARPGGREEGLPGKRRGRVGDLGAQRVRQSDLTAAGFQPGSMPAPRLLELGTRGQKRCAGVAPFPVAEHERVALEGEHVAARAHRLEVVGAKEALQGFQGRHFQVEDAPGQEDEGTAGLVLGGDRAPTLHGEGVQQGSHLGRAPFAGVAALVETEEGADPVEGGFFGARERSAGGGGGAVWPQ